MGNTRLWDPFWNEIAIFMVHQYPITILQKIKKNLAYVGPFVDYLWNNKQGSYTFFVRKFHDFSRTNFKQTVNEYKWNFE